MENGKKKRTPVGRKTAGKTASLEKESGEIVHSLIPGIAHACADETASPRRYEVITDRGPFWGEKRLANGAVILACKNDEAIGAMLERRWIREL